MEKKKNTELSFLYNEDYPKNKIRADKNSARREKFNFDNEIVIGVTEVKQNNKAKRNNKVKQRQNRKRAKRSKKNIKSTKVVDKAKNDKKNRVKLRVVKWLILITAIISAIIFFMLSPLFNLVDIEVINNEKISKDTIISLSQIKLGENIYKTSNKKAQENIKQNAYIETVTIQKKLPNKIVISVKERQTTFIIQYANSYAYINNQGYILEISEEKLQVPVLIGCETNKEEIKAGDRLNNNDLEKLSRVLKLMESAKGVGIEKLITGIDIQDTQNCAIIFEGEKKIAYLGDVSNLSNRMLYLKAVLDEEKGIEGEIFINGDLNKTDVYFRRKE